MAVGYQYTAMTITGAFHLGFGIFCFIISLVGFSTKTWFNEDMFILTSMWNIYSSRIPIITSTIAFIVSLWIIMVGLFGILAGRRSSTELNSNKMKTTYMVLAILSASLFSGSGITVFSYQAQWLRYYGIDNDLYILFSLGAFIMFAEFVLAIVSSSICCCCSRKRNDVMLMQDNQATEFVNPGT